MLVPFFVFGVVAAGVCCGSNILVQYSLVQYISRLVPYVGKKKKLSLGFQGKTIVDGVRHVFI